MNQRGSLIHSVTWLAAVSAFAASCTIQPDPQIGQRRQELDVCAAGATIPGIDVSHWQGTINWDQAPNDTVWFTVSFDPFGSEVQDYCGSRVEQGEIRLVFFGDHGIGEEALMQSAESVATQFAVNNDPNERLVLEDPGPPIGYGDVPFAVEIPIYYQFYL